MLETPFFEAQIIKEFLAVLSVPSLTRSHTENIETRSASEIRK
jgi:hypothetical protein